jgi:hypothetical protein
MAKKFETLRRRMSPAARAESDAEYGRLIEKMPLFELRQAIELTQAEIAQALDMGQGDVSKLEHRTDMYVSTLARYLQAIGADLEIRAVFENGRVVQIKQFENWPSGPRKVMSGGGRAG